MLWPLKVTYLCRALVQCLEVLINCTVLEFDGPIVFCIVGYKFHESIHKVVREFCVPKAEIIAKGDHYVVGLERSSIV